MAVFNQGVKRSSLFRIFIFLGLELKITIFKSAKGKVCSWCLLWLTDFVFIHVFLHLFKYNTRGYGCTTTNKNNTVEWQHKRGKQNAKTVKMFCGKRITLLCLGFTKGNKNWWRIWWSKNTLQRLVMKLMKKQHIERSKYKPRFSKSRERKAWVLFLHQLSLSAQFFFHLTRSNFIFPHFVSDLFIVSSCRSLEYFEGWLKCLVLSLKFFMSIHIKSPNFCNWNQLHW